MSSHIEQDNPGAFGNANVADPAQPPQAAPENQQQPGQAPNPEQNQGQNPNPSQPVDPLSKPREEWGNAEWYLHRKKEVIRKEADAEVERRVREAEEKFMSGATGALPEDQKELMSYAKDTTSELMQYKVNDFIAVNPHFGDHKAAIAEAVAEGKYPGLSISDVALLVAGRSLLAKTQQQENVDRHTPASGSSARAFDPNKSAFDPSSMSLADIESVAQKSKAGHKFS